MQALLNCDKWVDREDSFLEVIVRCEVGILLGYIRINAGSINRNPVHLC